MKLNKTKTEIMRGFAFNLHSRVKDGAISREKAMWLLRDLAATMHKTSWRAEVEYAEYGYEQYRSLEEALRKPTSYSCAICCDAPVEHAGDLCPRCQSKF